MNPNLSQDLSRVETLFTGNMNKPAIIIDNGSCTVKAGLSGIHALSRFHRHAPVTVHLCTGASAPSVAISPQVGYPDQNASRAALRSSGAVSGWTGPGVPVFKQDYYIGAAAQQNRKVQQLLQYRPFAYPAVTLHCPSAVQVLHLKNALKNGQEDMDEMAKIWKHIFDNELRIEVDSEDADDECRGVLMTEPPLVDEARREKMFQIMFEDFRVRRLYVSYSAVLAVHGAGRATGLAVDCGHAMCHAVPVFEGYSMPHAIQRIDVAGHDLTNYLASMVSSIPPGYKCSDYEGGGAAAQMKEALCYVSTNFDAEVANFDGSEKQFEMPDGAAVTVHNQIIRCAELMFKPELAEQFLAAREGERQWRRGRSRLDTDGDGIISKEELAEVMGSDGQWLGLHEIVNQCVNDCDQDLRPELLQNVILCGGTTMFPNMPERLQAEMSQLRGLGVNHEVVQVVAPPERTNLAWLGGSILTELSTFKSAWLCAECDPDATPPIVGYEDLGRSMSQMQYP